MKQIPSLLLFAFVAITISCKENTPEKKGFAVNPNPENTDTLQAETLNRDSLKFETRPGTVLLTGLLNMRLTPVFKVNSNRNNQTTYIGTTSYYYTYEEPEENRKNNWNQHLMPGFEAVYGYNMVNISNYNIGENKRKDFFEKPVLIKTLYYPAFSNDTLNNKPVKRAYFMVSVYNNDTNKDGFINLKDLRRFYLFNMQGEKQTALVPENYSVLKSEYDSDNDLMYVFAQSDSNQNGKGDVGEPFHIFWINLNDPTKTGRLY